MTQGTLQGRDLDAQLAKLLYSGDHTGVWPTTQEAMLALKLDDNYSKRQILAMYLDAAYFGHGAWVEKASRVYFGLDAEPAFMGPGEPARRAGERAHRLRPDGASDPRSARASTTSSTVSSRPTS